ncbi:putative membrane protein [Exiguobacterium sp. S17]|nr:putative membrane protein [Exiguobacterium sp. S17]
MRWWIWIAGLVVTVFIVYLAPTWLPFVLVVSYFPYLCLEWRKTKLLLTFNENRRYKRWVYMGFMFEWLGFVTILSLFAAYHTGFISIQILLALIVSVGVLSILSTRWLNRFILTFDDDHVTGNMLSEAKEQRNTEHKTSQ